MTRPPALVALAGNQQILLSDTVGFIKKLPHHLVAAFKATLEEVAEADLLLHVVDASHPQATEQIDAVNIVLEALNAAEIPTLMVFNKIDLLEEQVELQILLGKIPGQRRHFSRDGRRTGCAESRTRKTICRTHIGYCADHSILRRKDVGFPIQTRRGP